jgi:predicted SAM-dependent methyltransferase
MLYYRVRRHWRRLQRAYRRQVGPRRLLKAKPPIRIVIGASGWCDAGWIPTEQVFLDLTKPTDWERFFRPNSIDAMLAEHVWEHLHPEEGRLGAQVCYTYLKPGGYLRLAVPDGFHPSSEYIEWSRVGGRSPMQLSNDHKVLFTYRTLRELFESAGFRVVFHEYFDENGTFCYHEWNPKDGMIRRSKRFDKRNRDGKLVYTSIIMDALKP